MTKTFEDRMTELRAWYRGALETRLRDLVDALGGLLDGDGDPVACAALIRAEARSVHDSGGSYGFPLVSEAGRFVAEAPAEHLRAAAVGLADVLRDVIHEVEAEPDRRCHGWAEHLLGPLPDAVRTGLTPGPASPKAVWSTVGEALDLEPDAMATRLAERLGVDVAEPGDGSLPARHLVPAELARSHGLVPLTEDGVHVWAASPHPTDLRALLALSATTGRTPVLDVATPERVRTALDGGDPASMAPGAPRRGLDPARDGPPRVLIVEDESDQRLLARAVLERRGYRVVEATDGVDGLEKLARTPVDLVIVDLGMPRLDGETFLRRVREDPDHGSLPVIVLTGSTSPSTEVDVIEMGADDYLVKPLEPRLFLARVRATLRRAGSVEPPP